MEYIKAILISWLSYTYVEKPSLRLKRYFRFDQQKLAIEIA